MITTVIADDEPMIVRGLSKLIDWKKLGFDIVGTAYDGKEALHLVREKRPRLLISDINMPDYSGIEILKILNSENTGTQVIFISGFHDFEYAHAAIKYGAVDYLLKPVNKKQLLEAISRILEKDDSRRFPVTSGKPLLPFSELGVADTGYFTVLNCTIESERLSRYSEGEVNILRFSAANTVREELAKSEDQWVVEKENHLFVVLRKETRKEALQEVRILAGRISAIITEKFQVVPIIGAGKTVSNSAQLNDAYFSSFETIDNRYYHPDEMVLFYRDATPRRHSMDDLYTSQSTVIDAIFKFNSKALSGSLVSYSEILSDVTYGNREATLSHALGLIVTTKKRLESIDINLEPMELDSQVILGQLHSLDSFTLLIKWLEDFMQSILREMKEYQETKIHPEIQKIKDYIDDHFSENVSLQDLSNIVFLHPNYLSSHFKKYTGKNFKDYLTEKRMAEAEILLNTSDLKVYEVAGQVGFTDYRYFSAVFKRTFGVNPREYRKKL